MRVKNKRVKKIALGLVVVMLGGALLSGIAGITGAGSEQSNNADQNSDFVVPKGDPISIDGVLSEDVYTFVCEIPGQQKPELIYFACADGNNGIGKIEWSTWEATGATGVGEYFANDNVALAQGKAFCDELRGGSDAIGFKYQQIAVKNFCAEYLDGFEVIPTPEEQQEILVTTLREKDLAGTFSSELDAVNKAKAVCANLDSGGEQEGPIVEFIAVSVYCDKYENGFRTLKELKVKATFTITEDDPFDSWFPSISKYNDGSCAGQYGYRDISSSTVVSVTNEEGVELATTSLGEGKGTYYKCVFSYSFTLLEGEKYYEVEVGDRGALRFTESELKIPGALNSGLW
jgi:hypothetical protein